MKNKCNANIAFNLLLKKLRFWTKYLEFYVCIIFMNLQKIHIFVWIVSHTVFIQRTERMEERNFAKISSKRRFILKRCSFKKKKKRRHRKISIILLIQRVKREIKTRMGVDWLDRNSSQRLLLTSLQAAFLFQFIYF